jgi:hypothetical protein
VSTDRELLKLAAKAVGIELLFSTMAWRFAYRTGRATIRRTSWSDTAKSLMTGQTGSKSMVRIQRPPRAAPSSAPLPNREE